MWCNYLTYSNDGTTWKQTKLCPRNMVVLYYSKWFNAINIRNMQVISCSLHTNLARWGLTRMWPGRASNTTAWVMHATANELTVSAPRTNHSFSRACNHSAHPIPSGGAVKRLTLHTNVHLVWLSKMCSHCLWMLNTLSFDRLKWILIFLQSLRSERSFCGMFDNLNLHQSVWKRNVVLTLQPIHNFSRFNLWLLLQKETWRHALYHVAFFFCYPFLIKPATCGELAAFFCLCNSRKGAMIFPCLLNCVFPSFDIIALAAPMNSNGWGDFFPSNYEVDFPDDLHYYSIFRTRRFKTEVTPAEFSLLWEEIIRLNDWFSSWTSLQTAAGLI